MRYALGRQMLNVMLILIAGVMKHAQAMTGAFQLAVVHAKLQETMLVFQGALPVMFAGATCVCQLEEKNVTAIPIVVLGRNVSVELVKQWLSVQLPAITMLTARMMRNAMKVSVKKWTAVNAGEPARINALNQMTCVQTTSAAKTCSAFH